MCLRTADYVVTIVDPDQMPLSVVSNLVYSLIRPRGYKTFFMLNSAEREISPAYKSQITDNKIANSFFLNIAEHEHFSANKYENANYCWHFRIY